jgi:hypothetical protein
MAMSDAHQDLESIHNILLGQRQVATIALKEAQANTPLEVPSYTARIECIDDLLLEFEAAGVVWPTNVVCGPWAECECGGDLHPQCGPNC